MTAERRDTLKEPTDWRRLWASAHARRFAAASAPSAPERAIRGELEAALVDGAGLDELRRRLAGLDWER